MVLKMNAAGVSFVVPVKGRLHHLKQTLPGLVKLGHVCVVDYDCPDGTGEWVNANFPQVEVERVENAPIFNLSKARNIGARKVKTKWVCFTDCDLILDPKIGPHIEQITETNGDCCVVFNDVVPGFAGFIYCPLEAFRKIEGYDEDAQGYGYEDTSLRERLSLLKLPFYLIHRQFATHIEHSNQERTAFYDEKIVSRSWEANQRKLTVNLAELKTKLGL